MNILFISPNSPLESVGGVERYVVNLIDYCKNQSHFKIIGVENFHVGLPPAYSLLLNMVAGLHNIPLILRLHSFAVTDLQIELVNQLMWNKISCVSKSVTGDCFQKGADINILSTDYLGVNINEFNKNVKTKHQLRTS